MINRRTFLSRFIPIVDIVAEAGSSKLSHKALPANSQ